MANRTGLGLVGMASLVACSTIVGADFDDRNEGVWTTGGSAVQTGGVSALGGQGTGGASATGGAQSAGTGGIQMVASGGTAGAPNTGGISGTTATSGGTSGAAGATSGGIGPAGSGGQGNEGGAGGEPQAGAGGEPQAGTGGDFGAGGMASGGGVGGDGGAPGGPPIVVLNEIHGQGQGSDFIEIYNRGPGPLDLEGYGLSDENNTFFFPAGASIADGGYVLLLLDQTELVGVFQCYTPAPCFHAGWGVSQNGESVYFRGRQNQALDSTHYPDQRVTGGLINGQNWGRFPDGRGAFRAVTNTPEEPNQPWL